MSGRVAVRSAAVSDAQAVCAIYNRAIAERRSTFETAPRAAADFDARIADTRFPLLVSAEGETVIGWAGLARYSDRQCYAGIGEASVYVDAAARGRGIGTKLAEALASAAGSSGFHKMIGKLFTDNVASRQTARGCRTESCRVA